MATINLGNITGPQGPSGIGDAKVSNVYGTSTTDGYTQYYLNKQIDKKLDKTGGSMTGEVDINFANDNPAIKFESSKGTSYIQQYEGKMGLGSGWSSGMQVDKQGNVYARGGYKLAEENDLNTLASKVETNTTEIGKRVKGEVFNVSGKKGRFKVPFTFNSFIFIMGSGNWDYSLANSDGTKTLKIPQGFKSLQIGGWGEYLTIIITTESGIQTLGFSTGYNLPYYIKIDGSRTYSSLLSINNNIEWISE